MKQHKYEPRIIKKNGVGKKDKGRRTIKMLLVALRPANGFSGERVSFVYVHSVCTVSCAHS